jgi:transcriptional regulator with XRE-family HTH domain
MIADFAFAVRTIRQALGLSQRVIAERCSMPRSWISKIEGYNQTPTIESIHKLARALNVPTTVLVVIATAKEG